MNLRHAAVWVDHNDARVYNVDEESFGLTKIHAPHHHVRRHETTTAEHQHPADLERFYGDVARHLEGIEEILIVGPAKAKLELFKHIQKRHPQLVANVVGVETVDHPTDRQLVAFVRKYFREVDAQP